MDNSTIVPANVIAELEAYSELLLPLIAAMPEAGFAAYAKMVRMRAQDARAQAGAEKDPTRGHVLTRCAQRMEAFLDRVEHFRNEAGMGTTR